MCVFNQSSSGSGGGIFLQSTSPFIYISRCRFYDNNGYTGGYDVWVNIFPCLGGVESDSIDAFTCSNSTLGNRLYCKDRYDVVQLQNECIKDMWVCVSLFLRCYDPLSIFYVI
jgi:hypothetical protein